MDWMDAEGGTRTGITVENESDSSETVTIGCRTEDGVEFTETTELAPGEQFERPELPSQVFEIGVRVEDGIKDAERFHSPERLDGVTARIGGDSIEFSTNEAFSPDDSGDADAASGAAGAAATADTTTDTAGDDSTGETHGTDGQTVSDADETTSESDATPGPDEVYCRNCGTPVKKRAEICPECGVANAAYDPTAGTTASNGAGAGTAGAGGAASTGAAARSRSGQSRQASAAGQSQQSEPTSAGRLGVMLGGGLWLIAILILVPLVLTFQSGMAAGPGGGFGAMTQSLGLAALLPVVQILAWVVLPISFYLDLKYVDYHVDSWPLNGRLYIAAAVVLPLLTQILGAAALFMGSLGLLISIIIPVVLLWLSVRHLRTRSRVLDATDSTSDASGAATS